MNYNELKQHAAVFRNIALSNVFGQSVIHKVAAYFDMSEEDKHRYNPGPVIDVFNEIDYTNMALLYTERMFGQAWHFFIAGIIAI